MSAAPVSEEQAEDDGLGRISRVNADFAEVGQPGMAGFNNLTLAAVLDWELVHSGAPSPVKP